MLWPADALDVCSPATVWLAAFSQQWRALQVPADGRSLLWGGPILAGAATQWSRSEYGFARHKRDCFSIRWRAAAGMDFRGERHGLPVGRWIW